MNEWAVLWTAVLSAGSLIGITLVVRALMKTVRALEQAREGPEVVAIPLLRGPRP
jgi:hypothetical protein